MKYTIKVSGKFKKNYKLAQKRGLGVKLLKDIILKLGNGIALDEKHRDHALKGKFDGFRECHIQPDWLLIYLIEHDILTLTLVDTGTHGDLLSV